MNNVIIICTVAYNAEKTLPRTIDSVLSQTHKNFVYYLVDNGSTDQTGEIVRHYAQEDHRIVPHFNERNHEWTAGSHWQDFARTYGDSGYYCSLDADDEYKADALEQMLSFAEHNHLDIVACGSDFIDANTSRLNGVRALDDSLIVTKKYFSECFPMYHQFLRTFWGKLFSLKVFNKCDIEFAKSLKYGSDTAYSMEIARNSTAIGVLQGTLHKYYQVSASSSYIFDEKRIESDRILDDMAHGFLVHKCGFVSPNNDAFLKNVYSNAMMDTLRVLLNAQMPVFEKVRYIREIVMHEKTQSLFISGGAGGVCIGEKVRPPIVKWLLKQKVCRRQEGAKIAAEILLVMYPDLAEFIMQDSLEYLFMKMPETVDSLVKKDYQRVLERLQTWYKRHDMDVPALTKLEIAIYDVQNQTNYEIFTLLTKIREKRPLSCAELHIDMRIHALIRQYPLLKNISVGLATELSRAVGFIIKENFPSALTEFIEASKKLEISEDDEETYLLLGQNLSAAAEDANAYIYFKKVWISYMLDCSRNDEVCAELEDFARLLPDDEEFIMLRKRLTV